ncbi:MAG: hypothetical protein ACRC28_16535 [Clostridium sp.]|uniref:hypothetical protein n=1 Tax=Clostridium sp. TaxID=1506 RepID=UPI003F34E485
MKKTYRGAFPLLLSSFFLILWDIWRIRILLTIKPSMLNIISSAIAIIIFFILAYRSFHLYMDFLSIKEDRLTLAGIIRNKDILFKDISTIKKVDYSIVLTLKSKETLYIKLKDFNKKYRNELETTILNLKKRK